MLDGAAGRRERREGREMGRTSSRSSKAEAGKRKDGRECSLLALTGDADRRYLVRVGSSLMGGDAEGHGF
jgi:hypothetical protein